MKLFNSDNITLRKTSLALGVMLALGSGSVVAGGFTAVEGGQEKHDFSTLDKNDDDRISRDEYYSQNNKDRYRNWDSNSDMRVDENEWNELDRGEDFSSWDTNQDNYLDERELNEGSFAQYDKNSDSYLDKDEWDDAKDDGWFDDWF